MLTARMQRKLKDRSAIDVSERPKEGDWYVLTEVIDGMDYCNQQTGRWIWSIARRDSDGKIFASHFGDLYERPGFTCLWLR